MLLVHPMQILTSPSLQLKLTKRVTSDGVIKCTDGLAGQNQVRTNRALGVIPDQLVLCKDLFQPIRKVLVVNRVET